MPPARSAERPAAPPRTAPATEQPSPKAPEAAVASATTWRDDLRSQAKECTRAANFITSGLQQGKSPQQLLEAATRKFDGPAGELVKDVLADEPSPELIKQRVGELQQVSGILQRVAERGDFPTDAVEAGRDKGLEGSKPLKAAVAQAMARAAEAAPEMGAEHSVSQPSQQPTRDGAPAPSNAKPPSALQANQELEMEASREQIQAASQQQAKQAEQAQEAPAAAKAQELQAAKDAAQAERRTTEAAAGAQPARAAREDAPRPDRAEKPAQPRSESQQPERETRAAAGGGLKLAPSAKNAAENAAAERRAEAIRAEPSVDGPAQGGLRLRPSVKEQDAGRFTPRAQPAVAPPRPADLGASTRPPQSSAPPAPARATSPSTSAPEKAPEKAPENSSSKPPAPSTGAVQAEPAARQTLAEGLRSHMQARGFDNEAVALARDISVAVKDNASRRTPEQSLVVLHREGANLATATTERSVSQLAKAGDTVLAAKTLEHVADHGLSQQTLRQAREAAPEGLAKATDLEVAEKLGPAMLERADREGFPQQLARDMRESAEQHFGDDKAKAQQAALERLSRQWGEERKSPSQVLESASDWSRRVGDMGRARQAAKPLEVPQVAGPARQREMEHSRSYRLGG